MSTEFSKQSNPFKIFLAWYQEALDTKVPQPDAMTLATITPDFKVSARIVLYRGIRQNGLSFFTNYQSAKAKALAKHPVAALVFYWNPLHKQVRIQGEVQKLSENESDEYFRSRNREHQINAWVSAQSKPIESVESFWKRKEIFEERFQEKVVPRPPFWGGYCVLPNVFEFWEQGKYRFHKRHLFQKDKNIWSLSQLSP